MNSRNRRLTRILLAVCFGLGAMACGLAYWSVWRAPDLNSRTDNPRRLEAEARLQRGSIVTADSTILAENKGSEARQERIYPTTSGGHVVGYASSIHGTSGVEASMDNILRGDTLSEWDSFVRGLLHLPQVGQDVAVALDPVLQQQAAGLLNGTLGAVVILELPDACWGVSAEAPCAARLRTAVSFPTYDPNQLDAEFESLIADERSPLLNRAVQGQYQPGLTLQPILIAAALDEGRIHLTDSLPDAARPVSVHGILTTCTTPPPNPATWADVVRHACPAPMVKLGSEWGIGGLARVFDQFHLTTSTTLRLDTDITANEPLVDAAMAAIGQDNLAVTPLQMAVALSALAADGALLPPQVVMAEQDSAFVWQPLPPLEQIAWPVSAEAAQQTRPTLPDGALQVLSGPEGSTNGWYQAIVEKGQRRYVLVVVVEGGRGPRAQVIGEALAASLSS